ncbi:uncharacterized protein LOC124124274 [Haliotis rufescens]|uniref:uncharacterized protein LOC124124274 n=1 Tax=Haliotis rufescens TaxID=6454 RepID=UPI00201F78BB|nr:uncharacterized protein LOC124124274 [Haliotis rufescens]
MIRRLQLYFPPSAQSAAPCTDTAHTIPKLPKTRAEVDIAAPWRETHDGERFLLFADGEEDKMLLKVHIQHLLNQPFNPETFQVDFEVAAIRALRTEFQGSDIKGCFFHFTQAIWRKTQELGLADAWIDSMNQSPDVPNADEFNDYIVTNWVDYEARFPLSLWNHHQTFGPSTNNNGRLNASLNHRHHNLYRFIEIIKKIEKSEKTKLSQLDLGAAPPARKRVYKEIDNRLSRLKDQLSQGVKTPLQFLDAFGKLLKMD